MKSIKFTKGRLKNITVKENIFDIQYKSTNKQSKHDQQSDHIIRRHKSKKHILSDDGLIDLYASNKITTGVKSSDILNQFVSLLPQSSDQKKPLTKNNHLLSVEKRRC